MGMGRTRGFVNLDNVYKQPRVMERPQRKTNGKITVMAMVDHGESELMLISYDHHILKWKDNGSLSFRQQPSGSPG